MLSNNRVIINISGTGYYVYIDNKGILKELNDIDLFETLFLNDEGNASKQQQNYPHNYFSGVNILEKGQLDIWVNRKRKKTIQLSDINISNTLFPILNTEYKTHKNKANQILIAQQEKGLITKMMLPCAQFVTDDLLLHIIHIKTDKTELKLIREITYNSKQLISLKNDTVVTGSIIDRKYE